MLTLKISIGTSDLGERMRHRLAGAGSSTQADVVWQQRGDRVLLLTSSLVVRSVDGWLLCSLDVHSDQTGRRPLQFVFWLGRPHEGDGPRASATIVAPDLATSQLADRWGGEIQRVLWDAVLDVAEASVQHAAATHPGEKLRLRGFTCTEGSVLVDVLAGSG